MPVPPVSSFTPPAFIPPDGLPAGARLLAALLGLLPAAAAAAAGTTSGPGVTGTTRVIAQTGDAAPDGNGSFAGFFVRAAYTNSIGLNDLGQVAFRAELTGTVDEDVDWIGIFRGDGSAQPVQIARGGQGAHDGNGTFFFFGSPALNSSGQTAFLGNLFDTTGGSTDDEGIFRGDGSAALVQIVRAGQAAPDGNGIFLDFGADIALNDAGQAAFTAFLTDTSGGSADDLGIYLYDDGLGLLQVAREGDAFLGSMITELFFSPGFSQQDEGSGLNNLGQVAYSYRLADGRSGVAIWSIPEPASAAWLLAAFGRLARRRA